MYDICKRAKETYKKQLLSTFYISTGLYKTRKATVYVAAKLDYVASYFYMGIAKIAEANKLRTQALTPMILKQQWIDKWDGKLPVYGSLPTLSKGIE